MKSYKFESWDSDTQTSVVVDFDTESDAWHGYSGPMYQFFNFLKGNGFVFHHNAEIGVMNENAEFRSACVYDGEE